MSLVDFLDIRFGDPVSAMCFGNNGLAIGTYIGRVSFYEFDSSTERVLCEYSAEAVRGLYINQRNTLYVAIGDRHGLVFPNISNEESEPRIVPYERQHSIVDCPCQQTLLYKEIVCIVPVDSNVTQQPMAIEKEIYTMNLESMGLLTTPRSPLKPNSVVFDFDGRRILWQECTSKGLKTLKVTSVAPVREVSIIETRFGRRVTSARLVGNEVVFVRDFRHMYVVEIAEGSEKEELGVADCDILAFEVFSAREQLTAPKPNSARVVPITPDTREILSRIDSTSLVLLTLDAAGEIACWNSQQRELICDLRILPELKKPLRSVDLFSMQYRYLLAASRTEIAISTDVGIFILYSEKLGSLVLG